MRLSFVPSGDASIPPVRRHAWWNLECSAYHFCLGPPLSVSGPFVLATPVNRTFLAVIGVWIFRVYFDGECESQGRRPVSTFSLQLFFPVPVSFLVSAFPSPLMGQGADGVCGCVFLTSK